MEKEILRKLEKIEALLTQKEPVFISQKQVDEEFQIARATLHRRVKDGSLHKYFFGGKIFYNRSEIIEVIEKGKERIEARA